MTDLDGLLDLVPALRDRESVEELAGGLTNTNYKVVTPAGVYVVRVSAKDAGLLAIDRENEYLNTVSAADAGVGAPVVDYLPEQSLLVLEFILGTTQTMSLIQI
jgi:aminoglycoside phosphotransferase (APT) family kinase protein